MQEQLMKRAELGDEVVKLEEDWVKIVKNQQRISFVGAPFHTVDGRNPAPVDR